MASKHPAVCCNVDGPILSDLLSKKSIGYPNKIDSKIPRGGKRKEKTSAEAEVLRWRALVDDPNATDWARVRDNFPRSGASQPYMVNDPLFWYPYSHPPSRFEGSLQHDTHKSPNFNKQKINPWCIVPK